MKRPVKNLSRRLEDSNAEPRNADRALWGRLAVTSVANACGANWDLQNDPETVLADLLADTMHWCDAHNAKRRTQPINFESALGRARAHYAEERNR